MKSVCLAILNFNGRKHLEHLLPTAIAAVAQYGRPCPIIVLDNRSSDPDISWINREYPSVHVVVAPQNDFMFSYNWLLAQLQEEIVVLLNNDLRLDGRFLEPLLRHFQFDDVFAVSASSFDWEGRERVSGPVQLTLRNGFYDWSFNLRRQELCHTLYTTGGFMAVDRAKFLELGGFNKLFYPAYCEELDLCFRAWQRGWRSIYEPGSTVWHREKASWSVSPISRPNKLSLRHGLFFQWANLPMGRGKAARYWSLAKLLSGGVIKGNRVWLEIYPRALWDWLRIRKQYSQFKVSEEDLASLQLAINKPVIL